MKKVRREKILFENEVFLFNNILDIKEFQIERSKLRLGLRKIWIPDELKDGFKSSKWDYIDEKREEINGIFHTGWWTTLLMDSQNSVDFPTRTDKSYYW